MAHTLEVDQANVCFGSEADICIAIGMSALLPISTEKADIASHGAWSSG